MRAVGWQSRTSARLPSGRAVHHNQEAINTPYRPPQPPISTLVIWDRPALAHHGPARRGRAAEAGTGGRRGLWGGPGRRSGGLRRGGSGGRRAGCGGGGRARVARAARRLRRSGALPAPAAPAAVAAQAHRAHGAAAGARRGPGRGVQSEGRLKLPPGVLRDARAPPTAPRPPQDHPKLGPAGEVVTVRAGYARHSLYPQRVADYAVPGVLRRMRVRGARGGAIWQGEGACCAECGCAAARRGGWRRGLEELDKRVGTGAGVWQWSRFKTAQAVGRLPRGSRVGCGPASRLNASHPAGGGHAAGGRGRGGARPPASGAACGGGRRRPARGRRRRRRRASGDSAAAVDADSGGSGWRAWARGLV
jgi:hypothetical protein